MSVEMVIDENAKMCVQRSTDMFLPDTNYWSSSATTPYSWAPLETFFKWPSSVTRNYTFDLVGMPLEPVTPGPP